MKTYLQTIQIFSRDARLYLLTNTITSISYVGIYVMLFNLYLLHLGYGPTFIGLINAAAQFGVVLFSLPAGLLGQRWGSRRILIFGLSVATAGLGLVPLAEFLPTRWQAGWLLATYIVAWLGGAAYVVNSLPFAMQVTTLVERTHLFSIREALVPLALVAGSLLGGLLPGWVAVRIGSTLADPAPYRYTLFLAAALFGLAPLVMLATTRTQSDDPPPLASKGATRSKATAPIGVLGLMAVVMLLQLAGKSITDTFFNVYLDVALHLPPSWMGALAAVAQLLVVPIALVAPLIVMQQGKGWTIITGTLGMAVSLVLLALFPHWGSAGLGLMAVSALFAITTLAFTLYTQELVAPEWRSTMSGAMTMAMGLSRSMMALGGGYLITSLGFATLFWVGAGLTLTGALLFWGYAWLPQRLVLYRRGMKAEPST